MDDDMGQTVSTAAAFFLCPIGLVPVFFFGLVIEDVLLSNERTIANAMSTLSWLRIVEQTIAASAAGVLFAWFGAFLVGIPTYRYLHRRGIATLGRCALIGGIVSLPVGRLVVPFWEGVAVFGACGVTVAAAFCLIAGRSEPGRPQ